MKRSKAYPIVLRMREKGMTRSEIGAKLGISRSAVAGIINDPDGSKQLARRERYRGTCEDCGKRTNGASGYAAPRLCNPCSNFRTKYWTRERAIEAIQLWAAEHDGKPPVVQDWVVKGGDSRFPSASTLYGEGGCFRYWADAIEAAGFPRPRSGWYARKEDWTKEKIVDSIKAWADEHGRPPGTRDWRRAGDDHLSSTGVAYHFGSWGNAIEAAGFPRPKRGRTRRAKRTGG